MSDGLFARATRSIPGGVDSPVRSFASVGGEPFFTARGEGAVLWDSDGHQYLDFVQSWGAALLGHAHPKVVEAIRAAALDGTSFGTPTAREVELAEAVIDRVPSIEKVRLVSSGTEAGMTTVRLARGATGRSKIIKFAGCYHGHADALLVAAGSGVATLGIPGSAGVTAGAAADTVVVPYNDDAALDAAVSEHGGDLAAILVEPVAANMGVVAPHEHFLSKLRDRCDTSGALLIFDEVITGFRLGLGGAQARFGVRPDLTMLGKVLGGGLPLAALGGRADVMDELAPTGAVYQAGTLSGNPLATAAGLATLSQLDDSAYVELEQQVIEFTAGLEETFAAIGVEVQVPRAGTISGLFFAADPVHDYETARRADHARYARLFHALLAEGVFFPPSGYEALFVGLAHDRGLLDEALARIGRAARTLLD